MRLPGLFPVAATAVLVALGPAAAAATPAPAPAESVRVLAPRSAGDSASLVVDAPGAPEPAVSAVVTGGGRRSTARVRPLMSADASLMLVVDTSTAASATLAAGGQSGGAGLLLQLAADQRSGVVADRRPPVLAAPPAAGVADDLRALSALTAEGTRSTSAALTLALSRLPPGGATAIVLWTSAADAGGEAGPALAARLRAAGAVLIVVSAAPGGSAYWTGVAGATGGFATAPAASETPVRAFDRAADALRSRYLVTFHPPAGPGRAELTWTAGGVPTEVPFDLPAAQRSGGGGSALPLAAGGAVALLLLVAAALALLRRHRRDRRKAPAVEEPAADIPVPNPGGVRVFDIRGAGAPREIDENLFEPRAERDAREQAEQAARERRDRGA